MKLSFVKSYLVFVVVKYFAERRAIEKSSIPFAFINLDCLNNIPLKFVEAKLVFKNTQPTISSIIVCTFAFVVGYPNILLPNLQK